MANKTRVPRWLVHMGSLVANHLSSSAAYRLSEWIARLLAWMHHRTFRVLCANLAPVIPERSLAERKAMATHALALALRTYYELFRIADGHHVDATLSVPDNCPVIEWAKAEQEGTIQPDRPGLMVCALHMSNFDLAGALVARQGVSLQVLSMADPDAGSSLINQLRSDQGLTVTPVASAALRAAVRRLRAGRMVATGIDRPVSSGGMPLPFFGREAMLPVGHIRLALQTNARLVLAACLEESRGHYQLVCTPPIELQRTGDRETDILVNAKATLAWAEELIRSAPEQWLVFVPVWPDQSA